LSQKLKEEFDYGLILALLIVDDSDNYEYFCYKYKTSNKLKNRFKNISENFSSLKNKEFYSNDNIKKLIYLSDKNSVKDLLLFSACLENKIELSEFENLIKYTRICQVPEFPISGNYLKEHGYESGEKLGKKLKFLKEKWIENNFVLDKKIVDKSLNKVNRN
jgi:tRNA nucleotidyltransferase/poly(A) polymerase